MLYRLLSFVGYCLAVCILATLPLHDATAARNGKATLKARHARVAIYRNGIRQRVRKKRVRRKRLHRQHHGVRKARRLRMTRRMRLRRARLRRARLARSYRKHRVARTRNRQRLMPGPRRASPGQQQEVAVARIVAPRDEAAPLPPMKPEETRPARQPAPPMVQTTTQATMTPLPVVPPVTSTVVDTPPPAAPSAAPPAGGTSTERPTPHAGGRAAPVSGSPPPVIGLADEIMAVDMLMVQDATTSSGGYW